MCNPFQMSISRLQSLNRAGFCVSTSEAKDATQEQSNLSGRSSGLSLGPEVKAGNDIFASLGLICVENLSLVSQRGHHERETNEKLTSRVLE